MNPVEFDSFCQCAEKRPTWAQAWWASAFETFWFFLKVLALCAIALILVEFLLTLLIEYTPQYCEVMTQTYGMES